STPPTSRPSIACRRGSPASVTSHPTAARFLAWIPAISWRSRSSPVRTPISCWRISGRRGSRRSDRNRALTPLPSATATSPTASSRSRPASRPTPPSPRPAPPMNWRVSFLDRYRLTSNSDAHSPGKLGREATTFDCERDYFAIKHALETGHGYVGTVEFFPEEGKYHLDGHRKCEVRLTPKETLAQGGRCPGCGEPPTIGVEHRVEVLADRSEAQALPPPTAGTVSNLVPLPEILSEVTASGEASRAVVRGYDQAIAKLGSE